MVAVMSGTYFTVKYGLQDVHDITGSVISSVEPNTNTSFTQDDLIKQMHSIENKINELNGKVEKTAETMNLRLDP